MEAFFTSKDNPNYRGESPRVEVKNLKECYNRSREFWESLD